MGLETATYITDLDPLNPTGLDPVNRGDDHIRLVKDVLNNSLPNINGPVTADPSELNLLDGATASTAEINHLVGVTSAIQTQLDALTALVSDSIIALYPIGRIIQTTSATNPTTYLPGTWTQIAQGRTLIGEGSGAGLTTRVAGDATIGTEDAVVVQHNHSVTDPGHGHSQPGSRENGNIGGNSGISSRAQENTLTINTQTTGISIQNEGVSGVGQNMQPSLVVYIWERTS